MVDVIEAKLAELLQAAQNFLTPDQIRKCIPPSPVPEEAKPVTSPEGSGGKGLTVVSVNSNVDEKETSAEKSDDEILIMSLTEVAKWPIERLRILLNALQKRKNETRGYNKPYEQALEFHIAVHLYNLIDAIIKEKIHKVQNK